MVKCMDLVYIRGQMVENMKVITRMIKKMAKVYSGSVMAISMRDIGKKDVSMDMEF